MPPDNASIIPVQSREWSVFGLLQNLCVLGVTVSVWVILSKTIPHCWIRSLLEQICGASVGIEAVMIYVRVRLLLRWIKTS